VGHGRTRRGARRHLAGAEQGQALRGLPRVEHHGRRRWRAVPQVLAERFEEALGAGAVPVERMQRAFGDVEDPHGRVLCVLSDQELRFGVHVPDDAERASGRGKARAGLVRQRESEGVIHRPSIRARRHRLRPQSQSETIRCARVREGSKDS
jgi:hypothetical protein